ncbi:2-hydroxychromene-2-carboxylate isomerase [Lampropedia puyangensis]|uniref:2-hydroxychromene-2-carboxylate isomerase n=1 Tax=Lampropedia puyangensis TaxID=1330072 RepID=A0A4S8F6N8_9BURK|nr:2-hydroxychromene-2-carboxylate isomerase [Lampropedia puyangensis]THU02769.1 2-hydroxychromene-2-carboxylate isomerase [Lampropedia puyangensis]
MKSIQFFFDFVSPYAYLAFQRLPKVLQGSSYHVAYKPVVLGGIFKEQGITAPASIPVKHDWIRRHTLWLAEEQGDHAFRWPDIHPFNSVGLSRLALACSVHGSINRFTAQTIFEHVWHGGADPLSPARLQALEVQLQAQLAQSTAYPLGSDANKLLLRALTQEAVDAGVFGVPAYVVDGQMLWGLDALPMLKQLIQEEE